eukprot:COSAG05_NODE_1380_length_5022_cov_25.282348_3_plen_89_part_00
MPTSASTFSRYQSAESGVPSAPWKPPATNGKSTALVLWLRLRLLPVVLSLPTAAGAESTAAAAPTLHIFTYLRTDRAINDTPLHDASD